MFDPPATKDWQPPPERAYLPLPCVFRLPDGPEPGPSIQTLQRALQRHRLLFLWYAHPAHRHVPDYEAPDKGDLYDRLDSSTGEATTPRGADDIFLFAAGIETWLTEQQAALGTGRGKPLETRPWPAQHNAYWTFQPGIVTPLQDSHDSIARLVGAALKSPRPDWLTADDVSVLRACESLAQPMPTDDDMGLLWTGLPDVAWDYPDRVGEQVRALDRLGLLEQGASGIVTPQTTKPNAGPISHSDDYTSVTAFGKTYQFSKGQQAAVVRVLIEAYRSGNPTLSDDLIAEKIDTSSSRFRMAHLFRSLTQAGPAGRRRRKSPRYTEHEAWGTLIHSPKRGIFAIRDPNHL